MLDPVAASDGCGASCPVRPRWPRWSRSSGRVADEVSPYPPTATQPPSNPQDAVKRRTSAELPDAAFDGPGAVDAVQLPPDVDECSRSPAVPPAVLAYWPAISHTVPVHESSARTPR